MSEPSALELNQLAAWMRQVPETMLSDGSPNAFYFERAAEVLDQLAAARRAAPAQEPVAWQWRMEFPSGRWSDWAETSEENAKAYVRDLSFKVETRTLYAAPPPDAKAEPVAWADILERYMSFSDNPSITGAVQFAHNILTGGHDDHCYSIARVVNAKAKASPIVASAMSQEIEQLHARLAKAADLVKALEEIEERGRTWTLYPGKHPVLARAGTESYVVHTKCGRIAAAALAAWMGK